MRLFVACGILILGLVISALFSHYAQGEIGIENISMLCFGLGITCFMTGLKIVKGGK